MAKIKLNTCPFCGEKPDIIRVSEHSFFTECKGDKCRAVIFTYGHTPEQAAEKWNSRTEQSQEQKRGRWKLGSKTDNACVIPSDLEFYCTCCGKEAIHDYDDTQVLSDFCPNCGADMREEGTDNG